MEFEKLFAFVHDLDSSERRNFSLYVGNRKKSRTYKLYQLILKYSEFDDLTADIIRQNGFRDRHQFHQDREKLLTWLIKSILGSKSKSQSALPFIRECFLHKADALGRKAFFREIRRLATLGEYQDWASLHDLVFDLENRLSARVEWPKDKEWLERYGVDVDLFQASFVFERLQEERELHAMIAQLREFSLLSAQERQQVAEEVAQQLRPSYSTPSSECMASKIRMTIAYYQEDIERAYVIGKTYISVLMGFRNRFGIAMIARELRFVAALCIVRNDRSSAIYYTMKLSELEPKNQLDSHALRHTRAILYSTVAGCFAETKVARSAREEIRRLALVIEPRQLARWHFNLGTAFFYNEDYREASRDFHLSRNLIRRDHRILQWEPSLLLAICHHEIGNIDLSDSMLESANNAVEELKTEFPKSCISIVWEYLCAPPNAFVLRHKIQKALAKFDQLLNDPEERRASIYFAVRIWLKAKLRSQTPREILLEEAGPEMMRSRLQGFS